mmetsp:Transcript_12328/g.28928  ORF Transcript_12328/g.28928 Transcript_12328/m.28928 type:complete len:239 (-) Transcript_12328:136-852(-)
MIGSIPIIYVERPTVRRRQWANLPRHHTPVLCSKHVVNGVSIIARKRAGQRGWSSEWQSFHAVGTQNRFQRFQHGSWTRVEITTEDVTSVVATMYSQARRQEKLSFCISSLLGWPTFQMNGRHHDFRCFLGGRVEANCCSDTRLFASFTVWPHENNFGGRVHLNCAFSKKQRRSLGRRGRPVSQHLILRGDATTRVKWFPHGAVLGEIKVIYFLKSNNIRTNVENSFSGSAIAREHLF